MRHGSIMMEGFMDDHPVFVAIGAFFILLVLGVFFGTLPDKVDQKLVVESERKCVEFCNLYEKQIKHFDYDQMQCSCQE